MKKSTASSIILFLLIYVGAYVSYATLPFTILNGKISSFSHVCDEDAESWKRTRENIISHMRNYDVSKILTSMNKDVQRISFGIPDEQLENFRSFPILIDDIDDHYQLMVLYYQNHKNNNFTMDERSKMIETILNITLTKSLIAPLQLLDGSIFLLNNFLDELRKIPQNYSTTCSTHKTRKSFQSTVYNILKIALQAELEVYFILNVALDIIYYYEPGKTDDVNHIYDGMIEHMKTSHELMIKKYQAALSVTSRDVWRCDPKPFDYKEGVTYIKLKHVFQGYIRNRRDLQDVSNITTCQSEDRTCGSLNPTKDLSCVNNSNHYGETLGCSLNRECAGLLWDCIPEPFKNQKSPLQICLSVEGSERSYDFAETYEISKTRRYGSNDNFCNGSLVYEHHRRGIFDTCSTCYCVCDDDLYFEKTKILSERAFYTGLVVSDVSKNYVITGARFRKYKGIVYIQVQQGKLMDAGNIDERTIHWKNESIDDLMNPRKHFKLRWEARSIELSDVDVFPGNVLVGMSFNFTNVDGVERLRLQAESQPFIYLSGKLFSPDKTAGYTHFNKSKFFRNEVGLGNLKLPNSTLENQFVVTNQYINFSISEFESDLGQSTIPFIDIQDVTTDKPFPMSGVGLYYRRSHDQNFAGFIGLKLKTFDYSQNLEDIDE